MGIREPFGSMYAGYKEEGIRYACFFRSPTLLCYKSLVSLAPDQIVSVQHTNMFYKMYICVYLAINIMRPLFCNDSQTPNIIYFLTQRVYKGTHFYNVASFSVRLSISNILCHFKSIIYEQARNKQNN